jgi:hypothetical protein
MRRISRKGFGNDKVFKAGVFEHHIENPTFENSFR